MVGFEKEALQTAQASIASTIRKNEKVYQTLSQKANPRPAQLNMVAEHLEDFRIMLALIRREQTHDYGEAYPSDRLKQLRKAMPYYVQQIEAVKPKFKEGTPQFTLADRRIKAYHIVLQLLEQEASRSHQS